MELNSNILYVVAALVGGLVFYRSKYKTEKNITDNMKTKEKMLEKDREIINKEADNKVEAAKRKAAKEKLNKEKGKDEGVKSLVSFFIDHLNKK